MLKRFHQKHANSNNAGSNPLASTYAQIRKELSAKKVDYAKRHGKTKPTVRDTPVTFECIKTDEYIFQGVVRGEVKSGEGVLMQRNGTLVVGTWREGKLDGRALIFTPFGGRVLATFNMGKLSGWTLAFYGSDIIRCTLYYENQIDGERLTFDEGEKMWVACRCAADGKMLQIVHAQKGMRGDLPSFIHSEDLRELLYRYVIIRERFLTTQLVDQVDISLTSSYVGFVDEERRPCGLGCVFGERELYCGNFFEGVLEHYGRMMFQNGDIYHGELMGGVFWGNGMYYSPERNMTSILMSGDSEQRVDREFVGYVMIDMVPSIGVYSVGAEAGIKGNAVKKIIESLQPYYLRQFKVYKKQNNNRKESSASLYGHSQDINIDTKQDKEGYAKDTIKQENRSGTESPQFASRQSVAPPQKWLNFPAMEVSEVGLRKSQSLDKRDVAARKKAGYQIKVQPYPSNLLEFESAQIKQNFNVEESEAYQKNAPSKTKLMQEIPFGKLNAIKVESKSLDLEQVNARNFGQEGAGRSKTKEVKQVFENELEDSYSGISDNSKKLDALFEKGKVNRKKIFY